MLIEIVVVFEILDSFNKVSEYSFASLIKSIKVSSSSEDNFKFL